jgi:hypothetical protein
MFEFQPSRHMLQLEERFDGIAQQLEDQIRARIGEILDQMAVEFRGHEIEYSCAMGSLSLAIDPPLVSEDGERELDCIIDTVGVENSVRWYDDPRQKLFARRALEVFAIDAWLCEATRVNSSELGSITRGTKRG